jgi:uroporphyrinogen decarboxylase
MRRTLYARPGTRLGGFDRGGVSIPCAYALSTPDLVRAEVKRRIHDLAPGGGFVLAAGHKIQPDVPPEKIAAMFDAAREFGTYPP